MKTRKAPLALNPFPANVPFMDKPSDWFLLGQCVKKHLW